uniref:Transcriptional regulator, ArsR family n=1 Tax=Methanococcus maripaludis (strain C6 / ATCC BAA-1332) TaxID=444158 RepID=A9A7Y3_METM6
MILKTISKKNVREILLLLESTDELYFNEIQKELGVNSGTLDRLLRDLLEQKLVSKRVEEKDVNLPKNYYKITKIGSKALDIFKIEEELKKMQKEL